jgi:hypothetical protein
MKNKKPNATLIWKQLEDLVVPRLRLSVIDRAVYSHLLRHSRLEGKLRLRWLYRERRLTAAELAARLRALDALTSGKLRPTVS